MQLKISHVTTYTYDEPVHYALQQLRLTPRSGHGQTVLQWESTVIGGTMIAVSLSLRLYVSRLRSETTPTGRSSASTT